MYRKRQILIYNMEGQQRICQLVHNYGAEHLDEVPGA
jgi:hypothetical protein